jgi:hypothetical protein
MEGKHNHSESTSRFEQLFREFSNVFGEEQRDDEREAQPKPIHVRLLTASECVSVVSSRKYFGEEEMIEGDQWRKHNPGPIHTRV